MTIALVQEADSASSSVTLSATTAGNTVVVAVACLGPTSATGVTGITLGGNPDNFTLVSPGPSAHDTTSPNDYLSVSVWADPNCASGTALSVTGTGVLATWVWEFSGLAGATDVAQVLAVSTYQDSWLASAASQTTVPAEAWVAIVAAANQTATETITETGMNGWTLQAAHNGTSGTYDWGAVTGYQTVNTVGTPSISGTFSQPSMSVTAIVTFGMSLPAAPPPPAAAGTPLAGGVSVSGGSLAVQGSVTAGTVGSGSPVTQVTTAVNLKPVGPKTGNYTANPGEFVLVNCTHGNVTITLPAAPANGSLVGFKLISQVSGTPAVSASGSDVIDAAPAGVTQITPPPGSGGFPIGTAFILQYQTATATWYTQSTGTALPNPPAVNSPQPADAGFVSWSYDYAVLQGAFTGVALPATGNMYLVKCPVRAPALVSQVSYWITATGSGLTSGENFAGLYSSTGSLIATSADETTRWGSLTGLISSTWASATVNPPFVWAVFLCNGTTGPSLAVTGNQTATWANGRLTASQARFGRLGTTNTSLPSSISLLGISLQAAEYWVGLST